MIRRSRILACAFALAMAAGGTSAAASTTMSVERGEGDSCAGVAAPSVPGAVVQSISAAYVAAGTDQNPGGTPIPDVPAHCAVSLYLTHPGANDHVLVEVWLPTSGWNGRFEGTGGGGYAAGQFDTALAPAIQGGYAASSTDAGVGGNVLSPAAWALNANGSVNTALLTDFAYRSVHDMTVAAKQIVAAYYGRTASYAYWNGCSTGGRQGLMEAQRFPTDYNGILAAAPAINWAEFIPAELWPQVVMNQEKDFPSSCEFNAFTQAAVAACDRSDPVNGGIIDDPAKCGFDPRSLVGKTVVCDGRTLTITAADANVVRLIWQGPKTPQGRQLWYGLTKGAPFDGLAGTTTTAGGTGVGAPFPISASWISYFLKQDPSFDTSTITYAQFTRLFDQSVREYDQIIGTADPDLGAFEAAGGKMITWHGLADQLIFPQGTVDYYQRVQAATGGARNVSSFYRLFLAPGVQHCGGGNGPAPTDPLSALTTWVEHGKAPATLSASVTTANGAVITRDLHAYK
ncbi:MAG TPA: tannase/feruloyl esterase family alpha/beta hydrolase [Actinospica sp.]|jgi:feruloyl esterase|nr:tannase/feruloyl esterase family alpha/beta hydrolase [Actinospica sp.]